MIGQIHDIWSNGIFRWFGLELIKIDVGNLDPSDRLPPHVLVRHEPDEEDEEEENEDDDKKKDDDDDETTDDGYSE